MNPEPLGQLQSQRAGKAEQACERMRVGVGVRPTPAPSPGAADLPLRSVSRSCPATPIIHFLGVGAARTPAANVSTCWVGLCLFQASPRGIQAGTPGHRVPSPRVGQPSPVFLSVAKLGPRSLCPFFLAPRSQRSLPGGWRRGRVV